MSSKKEDNNKYIINIKNLNKQFIVDKQTIDILNNINLQIKK